MGSDVILWGVGTSRTMRAHWMLLELGVDYRFQPIGPCTGETHSGEFLRLNPRHKIPVLQHGSLVLTESAAIIEYLSRTFPNPQIYRPSNPESVAALSEWCYFIMSELDAASLYMVRRAIEGDLRRGAGGGASSENLFLAQPGGNGAPHRHRAPLPVREQTEHR